MENLDRNTCPEAKQYPNRVVQFGGGNFLRGFADWMIQCMNDRMDFNAGVSIIQSSASRASDQLNRQQGLYHLVTSTVENNLPVQNIERIDCINGCINPQADMGAFLHLAEDAGVQLVISNTTEAGIVLDTGDFSRPGSPASFPARLALFLHHRYRHFAGAGDRGLAIICCEMIEDAAGQLFNMVCRFSREWQYEPEFIAWLEQNNAFCSSLVDRIVPGFPKANAEAIQNRIGFADQMLVEANDYYLWVIEAPEWVRTLFPAPQAGLNLIYTDRLAPFRERKVKVLNGAHTATVALSMLAGLATVQQSVEHPLVGPFLKKIIYDEICPTIAPPENELRAYADSILERFASPAIRHEWPSIALNSLSKWSVRIVPTLLDYRQEFGRLPQLVVFSLAALAVMYRGNYRGAAIVLNDNPQQLQLMSEAWSGFDGSDSDISNEAASRVAEAIVGIVLPEATGATVTTELVPACAQQIKAILDEGVEEALSAVMG